MTGRPATRIQWNEPDAPSHAASAVRRGEAVELDLPADFHHALFRHLHTDEGAGSELVDREGGAELLREVATVRLLAELEDLAAAAAETEAQVHIQSPAPQILITPQRHGGP